MGVKRVFTTAQAKDIIKTLGIPPSIDIEQLRMGLDVELEHGTVNPATNITGDDPLLTAKIAWAHLVEIHDYYTRLYAMEQSAE